MKKITLMLLFIASCVVTFGQARCAFDEKMRELIASSPENAQNILLTEQKIRNYIAAHPPGISNSPTVVYVIPVVVHVMHTGGAVGTIYNPSDANITGAINYLNQVYAGTYAGMEPPFGGATVVNLELSFALAQRTPTCGYANGIDRVNASAIPNYVANGVRVQTANGCTDLELKDFARWDPSLYYNIWVVNKLDGFDGTSGQFIAGYAQFAGGSPSLDGTVMLATQMVGGNKVLPHEIGHAFNLYHPFQGSSLNTSCPVNTTCSSNGDMVCDTDPITNNVNGSGVYDFSCRTGTNACTGTAYTKNTEHNFMSYTNCFTLFTDGQKVRTQAAMSLPSRVSLGTSLGATPCGTVLNFALASDSRTENNAGTVAGCRKYTDYSYQMNIGAAPSATATATLTYSGTATKGVDYEVTTNGNFAAPSNILTFLAGSTTAQSFTVRVYDDAATESAETAIINFTLNNGGGNAAIGTLAPTFTLTINDNDAAPIAPFSNTQNIGAITFALGNSGGDALFNSKLQSKRVQILYKASELTAAGFTAGPISGISFYIGTKNSTRPFNNLTIKMVGTSTVNLYNGSAITVITGLNTVKNAFSYSTIAGYNNFTFDASYTWNGTDNIVVEVCYDNGTADALQLSDISYGYSDCGGSCATGNMFWQDGINCSGSFGSVNFFTSDVKPIIKLTMSSTGTPISTALNSTNNIYLGPNDDVYFYDGSGNIMARIKNLTAFDYGCTAVTIDRAGTATSTFWNNSASNNLIQKTLKVVPANNTGAGHYQITLYYTGTEVSNWQTATGKLISAAQVVKVSNGFFVPNVSPTVPHISDVTMVAGTSAAFGTNYSITGDFSSTGFSGFGTGVPGNPILTADFRTKNNGNFTDGTIWQFNNSGVSFVDALQPPGPDNNVLVQAAHTVALDAGFVYNAGKTVTVSGTLNCGTNTLSGTGAFTLSPAGTLGIGSPNGISVSAASGNILVSGSRTFPTTANYSYNGAANQSTGNGLPAAVNGLLVANTGAALNNIVTLLAPVLVSGTTTLTSGNLSIGANTLSLNGPVSYGSGLFIGSATSNLVIGGAAGSLRFDQSPGNNTLNILTVNSPGSAILGSLVLTVNTANINPGGSFTVQAPNNLKTN